MKKGFEILDNKNSRDSLFKYRESGALRGCYLGYKMNMFMSESKYKMLNRDKLINSILD